MFQAHHACPFRRRPDRRLYLQYRFPVCTMYCTYNDIQVQLSWVGKHIRETWYSGFIIRIIGGCTFQNLAKCPLRDNLLNMMRPFLRPLRGLTSNISRPLHSPAIINEASLVQTICFSTALYTKNLIGKQIGPDRPLEGELETEAASCTLLSSPRLSTSKPETFDWSVAGDIRRCLPPAQRGLLQPYLSDGPIQGRPQ